MPAKEKRGFYSSGSTYSLYIQGFADSSRPASCLPILEERIGSTAFGCTLKIISGLDAGNICYKLTQYMANAKAIGPFLQGFAKPIADLSRGASVSDIVTTSIITLALVPSDG